jgi:amidase
MLNDIEASGEPTIPNVSALYPLDRTSTSISRLWDLQREKWQYQCEYLDKWRELEEKLGAEMDAIIAPVTATASCRHNRLRYYGYHGVFNVLDFPCVVVPVTFVDKAIDTKRENYQPLNDEDAAVQEECE